MSKAVLTITPNDAEPGALNVFIDIEPPPVAGQVPDNVQLMALAVQGFCQFLGHQAQLMTQGQLAKQASPIIPAGVPGSVSPSELHNIMQHGPVSSR